jgi:hypothetical protein
VATFAVEKESKKRERGKGDKKMEKENMEHELVSNCLDYLLTSKVERKNYIEILNTIERRFAELGKTTPNPSLFLMFTSEKSDLVIGGRDVPEMNDLYRVTLDRKGYKRDEMWGDLDALWRLGITTITRVGGSGQDGVSGVPHTLERHLDTHRPSHGGYGVVA